jgi:hypothetical protein
LVFRLIVKCPDEDVPMALEDRPVSDITEVPKSVTCGVRREVYGRRRHDEEGCVRHRIREHRKRAVFRWIYVLPGEARGWGGSSAPRGGNW